MPRRSISIKPNEYEFDFTRASKIWASSQLGDLPSSETILFGDGFVNDDSIARCLGQILDPLLADLVDVALFVYFADRLSPRRRHTNPHHHFQWSRKIRLKIPVRRLEAWSNSETHESLRQLLRYFTEDDWRIDFVPHQKEKRSSESQTLLFHSPLPEHTRVALFSGGLDSYAGAVQQIAELPDYHFVLVSGVTNTRQGNGQREQVKVIKNVAPSRITHIAVSYGIRQGIERSEEVSQRSRGFLFTALGAATAIVAETRELYVYENGIGAINLPYDGTQVGTSNTRAVHPISLLRMSQFVSKLIQADFHIHNPFLFHTKAEMCSHPAVRRLGEGIAMTFSCDGFPIRKKDQPQCGICTSCLLRRQSLESAGLSIFDDSSAYLNDLQSYITARAKLRPLLAMEWQAQKIAACLTAKDPWQKLAYEFPSLMEIASEICLDTNTESERVRSDLLRLYSQYVTEWNGFSARGLISPQTPAD